MPVIVAVDATVPDTVDGLNLKIVIVSVEFPEEWNNKLFAPFSLNRIKALGLPVGTVNVATGVGVPLATVSGLISCSSIAAAEVEQV
jgi:hypothetical protein